MQGSLLSGHSTLHYTAWATDGSLKPLNTTWKHFSVQRSKISQKHSFLEGSRASPFCPFRKSSIKIKMSTEHLLVEWYWQEKTQVLGEKYVLAPLCPPQISYALTRDFTRTSEVSARRLTVRSMAWPFEYWKKYFCIKCSSISKRVLPCLKVPRPPLFQLPGRATCKRIWVGVTDQLPIK